MVTDCTLEKYLDAVLNGKRTESRNIIEQCMQSGFPANRIYMDILWPVMLEIEKLHRAGTIDSAQEHMASRINRTIVDQLQNKLPRKEQKDKKIVICCASTEHGELGAQMAADIFESDGWEVRFLGGGVTNDELISFTNIYSPDVLLVYGTNAALAPSVRALIDSIRDINACPDMKIMLSGGIFDRAEGLWEEIGADMYAETAHKAVELGNMNAPSRPVPTRELNKRKRNKRVSEELLTASK